MDKTREKNLEEINQCLDRIELDLIRKAETDNLEFMWEELVASLEAIHDEVRVLKDDLEAVHDHIDLEYAFYEMASKLESIHDEVQELKDEVADVNRKGDDPADSG